MEKILDPFLHPKYRIDGDKLGVARICVMIFSLVSIFLSIYSLFYLFLDGVPTEKHITNVIGVISSLFSVLLMRISSNLILPGIVLAIVGLSLITFSTYYSGGIFSSDLSFFFILCVGSMLVIGPKIGHLIFGLCTFVILCFYLLERIGYKDFQEDNQIRGADGEFLNLIMNLILGYILITFFFHGYNRLKKKFEKLSQQKINDLDHLVDKKIIELADKNKSLKKQIKINIQRKLKLEQIRDSIAKDFHDEMGNNLAGITVLTQMASLKIENQSQEGLKKILDKIEAHSKIIYDQSRDFIWSINSKSDNIEELITYLRDFGESFFDELNMNFIVKSEQIINSNLPLSWTRHIALIFKEAMTNAAKYSQAEKIEFSFSSPNPKEFEICLNDNGLGFDKKSIKPGNGLKNMQDRARKINGTLKLITAPDKGTQICLSINLEEDF